ncbi:Endonuclease V [Enhygromyxa salina]|uniref:Endonuclease V n=1 Tax=Enhygromyxa salina TaxID=215803 RepID=A0A0C1ZH50_9BACT|nr:endonuclease V [Enhygromyxa salina]KIG16959.1 Endonuclease V [Enhygromyxa salina]
MIACIDVDYRESAAGEPTVAVAACVVLQSWLASEAVAEVVHRIDGVAQYVPGAFYKRELPCLLAVLERVQQRIHLVVVDGYVVLDDAGTLGLGGYLHAALGGEVAVVGVAKSPFRDNGAAIEVVRGEGKRPVYVTALGVEPAVAAVDVGRMHGRFRLPTMLKRVDRLCRDS